jgi:DUF1680 family protein
MFLKLMGAMPGYIYSQGKTGIYVNLFVGSRAQIQVAGQKVLLRQETDYPWQGEVKIRVDPTKSANFDLHVRIPAWSYGPSSPDDLYQAANLPRNESLRLRVNGRTVENPQIVRGYATIQRRWKSGDVVQLTLDMPVQRSKANPHVEADNGRVALMRGPLVYCFEAAENGGAVQNLIIPLGTEFKPEYRGALLGGVTVLQGTATGIFQTSLSAVESLPVHVTAIPYYANANRGTCQMQVWMPEAPDGCRPQKQE